MSEAGQTSGTGAPAREPRANIDWFCNWVREGAERAAEMLTPPPAASQHFRESRIEFLRGVRELIDRRIERLSRDPRKGTRIVVD